MPRDQGTVPESVDPDVLDDPPQPVDRSLRLRPRDALLVGLGGVFGTAARYGVGQALGRPPELWPWATFAVNVVGAFVLGYLLEGISRSEARWRHVVRLVGGTGFCGAFTTYSSLALDAVRLGGSGQVGTAVGYVLASILAGIAAAWIGVEVAGRLDDVREHRARRSGR